MLRVFVLTLTVAVLLMYIVLLVWIYVIPVASIWFLAGACAASIATLRWIGTVRLLMMIDWLLMVLMTGRLDRSRWCLLMWIRWWQWGLCRILIVIVCEIVSMTRAIKTRNATVYVRMRSCIRQCASVKQVHVKNSAKWKKQAKTIYNLKHAHKALKFSIFPPFISNLHLNIYVFIAVVFFVEYLHNRLMMQQQTLFNLSVRKTMIGSWFF